MEGNTHAFAATPHKCAKPERGYYSSCDRQGCSQNTRDWPESYGPGENYTIDTRFPFQVRTQFPSDGGILVGMVTTMLQAERHVVLNHSSCAAQDLAALSAAMADGMSLRITYWGESAETMAWLDAPPCGRQACSTTAGDVVISDVSVSQVPNEVRIIAIKDLAAPALLADAGDSGSSKGGSLTLSHNSSLAQFRKDCGGNSTETPCQGAVKSGAGFADAFVKLFRARFGGDQHQGVGVRAEGQRSASPAAAGGSAWPSLLAACLFGAISTIISVRIYARVCLVRGDSVRETIPFTEPHASVASDVWSAERTQSRGEPPAHGQGRTGSGKTSTLTRSNSSSMQLMTLVETEADE